MSAGVDRPVIFPISNPTSQIEAMPADIIAWSKGKALVATGLPIPPVDYAGVRYQFGQANNALLYPGLGLGTIVSGASKVTDGHAAGGRRGGGGPGRRQRAGRLPAARGGEPACLLGDHRGRRGPAAADDGVATTKPDNLVQAVQDAIWQPAYPDSVS